MDLESLRQASPALNEPLHARDNTKSGPTLRRWALCSETGGEKSTVSCKAMATPKASNTQVPGCLGDALLAGLHQNPAGSSRALANLLSSQHVLNGFNFSQGSVGNNLKCLLRPDSQVRSHKASCARFLKCTLSWTWLDRLQASHWPVRASPCAASLPASRGAVCFLRRYFGTAESTMSPSTCGGIYLGPEYFLCRYFGYIR